MRALFTFFVAIALLSGCRTVNPNNLNWIDGSDDDPRRYGTSALSVRWSRTLDNEGAYIPVENGGTSFDPARNRLYAGTAEGLFYAFDANGHPAFVYEAGSGVEAPAAIDEVRGTIFLATEDGNIHAINRDGTLWWKENAGGVIRQQPIVTSTAIYVAREDDTVVAMDRETGEVFWRYRREGTVEYSISGRAGLLLRDGRIYTGFADGTAVCLDADDGTLLWQRVTAVDVTVSDSVAREFYDIDTTPVVAPFGGQDAIFVASFNAGLYALDPESGTVLTRRSEMTGITALAAHDDLLFLASAYEGVIALDVDDLEPAWIAPNEGSAPGQPVIAPPYVVTTEVSGSMRAFHMQSGQELARIDLGHGFSSDPTVYGRYGFVMTNSGRLVAFTL